MPARIIQSLVKGFFLQFSNLSFFHSPILPFHYNPETLKITAKAKFDTTPNQGATAVNFKGRDARTISFSLLFDDLNTTPVPPTMYAIMWLTEMVSPTILTKVQGTPKQPELIVGFGEPNTSFKCHLQQVDFEITMFSPVGTPARAKANVQLIEIPSSIPGQNPTSGGTPGREMHLVVSGDSLQSVSTRFYGKPTYWRAIALANDIDDPMRLPIGRTLAVPPLLEAKTMI